jgi:hypothetical protein
MQTLNKLEPTNKRLLVTAVSRNGEARDLSEMEKVINLKFCLYLLRLGLGLSPLLEAAKRYQPY